MNSDSSPSKSDEPEESEYHTEDTTVEVSRSQYEDLIDKSATAERVRQIITQEPPYQGVPGLREEPDHSGEDRRGRVPRQRVGTQSDQYASKAPNRRTNGKIKEDVEVFRRSALWAAAGSLAILIATASLTSVGVISVPTTVFLGGILVLTGTLFLKIWYDISD